MIPEYAEIAKLLNEIDERADRLMLRMTNGEDVNYLSLNRFRTSIQESRDALKVLLTTRAK